MRKETAACFVLGVLTGLLPVLLAARRPRQDVSPAGLPGAGIILDTAVIKVPSEPRRLGHLVALPEGARWAMVKNPSAIIVYVGASERLSAASGWPLGPGEELSFSVREPVYVRSALGDTPLPVLIGR